MADLDPIRSKRLISLGNPLGNKDQGNAAAVCTAQREAQ